jgi:leukotriene-A4 hydrolase
VFSSVPYEKGFNFLHYLTQVVGGHEVFEEFAKAYIKNFRYKTLTSEDFRQFFMKYFTETVDKKKQIQQINWDKWYNTPGMPLIQSEFDSTQTNQAISLGVNMSKSVDAKTWGPVTGDTVAKWPCALQVLLLDTLITEQLDRQTNLTKKHLDMIDNFANKTFTTSRNSEIRSRWYTIALRAKDDRQFANTASFLKEQGRMKYVRPLYRDLAKAAGVAHAKSVFARTKSIYHPIAAKMIQKDLDDAEAKEAEMKTTNIPSNPGCTFACVEKCVAQYVNLPKGWTGYALIAGVAVTAAFLARRR